MRTTVRTAHASPCSATIGRAVQLDDRPYGARLTTKLVLPGAHLLTAGALPAHRVEHALHAIQRNAQAQARLVESLLDLSRIMAGKLELNLQPIDLSKVLDAAIDVVRPQADTKGIALEFAQPSCPIVITADAGRLQQVFWNLLSNAVKFTPQGGAIRVRCLELAWAWRWCGRWSLHMGEW
jgi:signal transduction histidine kinase